MGRMRLTGSNLRRVVTESTMRILREAKDPMNNINALIDQANEAYQRIVDEFGPGLHLMDREGNSYGLSGKIRIDGRGYIIIPFDDPYGSYTPERIRVLTKSGGKLRIIKGDYMEQGWNDAKKILKSIIRDAERGYGHLQDYDPNWEDEDSYPDGKQRIRDFNKTHGFKRGANMNESHLYTGDINANDLRVSGVWNEDGYIEWEAKVDNGWYTFRGTYNGFDCELDEIIEGHSGHAVQHDIDDEAIDWFNETIADKVKVWLNEHEEDLPDSYSNIY